MRAGLTVFASFLLSATTVDSYAFVSRQPAIATYQSPMALKQQSAPMRRSQSSLKMIDEVMIQGAAIAVAGLAAGIGLVAFTEAQGERAKQRGGGLSETMATKIAGGLLEDVEVSSVDDLGSLTSQLEKALKESGAAKEEEFEITEETKKRLAEEADDGW